MPRFLRWACAGASVAVVFVALFSVGRSPPVSPGFLDTGHSARARAKAVELEISSTGRATLTWANQVLGVDALLPAATALRFDASHQAVELVRGEVIERWVHQGDRFEQQWRFERAPASGPFEVRFSNATLDAPEPQGTLIHVGGAQIRYGHATWVDARGTRTPIEGRREGSSLLFALPQALLEASQYPAVLDPVVVPEQAVSTDTAVVSVVGAQQQPSVAILGNTALVVWTDSRRSGPFGAQDTDIFGALVDISLGTVNITRRFTVAVAPGLQANPNVVAGGSEFLVVWTDSSSGTSDIRGALIPTTGPTGRPASFSIASTGQDEILPSAAYSSTESRYLVVFDSNNGLGPIQAVRVNPTTVPQVTSVFTVSASPNRATAPRVGWAGAQYVVGWSDVPAGGGNYNVYFSRVAANAVTASASVQVAAGVVSTKLDPEVVGGPNQHLIAWADVRGATPAIYGVIIDAAGNMSSTTGVLLRGIAGSSELTPKGAFMPAGASAYGLIIYDFNPTSPHFTTAWFSPTTLAAFGTPDSFGSSLSNGGVGIAMNSNFRSLAAYADSTDLFLVPGQTITSFNAAGTKTISASPSQDEARVAVLGNQVLVAWPQWNGLDGGNDLFLRRFGFDGVPLDATAKPLVTGPSPSTGALHLAAGGTEALALYSDIQDGGIRTEVFASRISSTGVVSAPVGITVNSNSDTASEIVFDGTNYLALWFSHILSGGAPARTVVAERLTGTGAAVGAAFGVHNTGATLRSSAAAANDAGMALVAVDYYGTAVTAEAIYRTFVTGSTSSDPSGGLVVADGGFPSVTSDGTNFLVVWEDHRSGTAPDIYGQRWGPTGTLLDALPVPLEVGGARAEKPNVSFNGSQYFLSWHERQPDAGYDVKGRWFSTTLQALNNVTLGTADDDVLPRAVGDGLGTSHVAFTRVADNDDPAVGRVQLARVSAGLPADPCTSSAQCFGGFCVGGVCCNKACNGACETCLQSEGATANGTCGVKTAGTVCRASSAVCDAVERCDGTAIGCPADGVEPTTTLCRAAAGDCDVADRCDGLVKSCPADAIADAGTLCSSTTLLCALSATCTGASKVCPATGVRPPDFICRPKAGNCDVEEKCDGVSQTCAPDGYADSTVVCRQSAGECDAVDHCSGNAAECPSDQFAPPTTVCRASLGVCDVPEYCSGSAASCPGNAFASAEQVCGELQRDNECDEPDVCAGDSASCGNDRRKPDGTSCAQGAGVCEAGACKSLERSRYGWGCAGCSSAGGELFFGAVLAFGMFRRRFRRGLPVVLLALTLSSSAFAQKQLKLVFTGVAPGNGVSEQAARSVAEYVQTELSRIEAYAVISQTDLQQMLGIERQKQLIGCSDAAGSCLAELAGALDADRLLHAEISRLDETMVLNFSLIDLRKGQPVARSGRTVDSGGIGAALKEIRPLLYELLNQAPEQKDAPLVMDQGFSGVMIGLRADVDVFARGVAPGLMAELSARYLGGVLTVLITPTPGVRAELRAYPLTFRSVRPYIGIGATVFGTGLGVRGGAGAAVRFGSFQIFADASYERFVANFRPGFSANAVLVGLGAGWQF
jgi:hypothetical protein